MSYNEQNWHSNQQHLIFQPNIYRFGQSDITKSQHISITSCINVQMDIGYWTCSIILEDLIWHPNCNPRAPTDMVSQIQSILDGCIYTWRSMCIAFFWIISERLKPMWRPGVKASETQQLLEQTFAGADGLQNHLSRSPVVKTSLLVEQLLLLHLLLLLLGKAIMMETMFSQQLI